MHRPRPFVTLVAIGAAVIVAPTIAAALERPQGPPPAAPAPSTEPVHAYVQLGTGIFELGNVKAGAFIGPHVSVEAMAAWLGVFEAHYGGGVSAYIGRAAGARVPRHALLVSARLMLNSSATFDTGKDDLSSYVALPVGYSYLGNRGFFMTATLSPIITRNRTDSATVPNTVEHRWGLGGGLINFSAGIAF